MESGEINTEMLDSVEALVIVTDPKLVIVPESMEITDSNPVVIVYPGDVNDTQKAKVSVKVEEPGDAEVTVLAVDPGYVEVTILSTDKAGVASDFAVDPDGIGFV